MQSAQYDYFSYFTFIAKTTYVFSFRWQLSAYCHTYQDRLYHVHADYIYPISLAWCSGYLNENKQFEKEIREAHMSDNYTGEVLSISVDPHRFFNRFRASLSVLVTRYPYLFIYSAAHKHLWFIELSISFRMLRILFLFRRPKEIFFNEKVSQLISNYTFCKEKKSETRKLN